MFDARYGRQVTHARDDLARAAGEAAQQIASVLGDNPVRPSGPYPLLAVHRQLAEQQRALVAAIERYPLAVVVDTEGRPDQLGIQLAKLMSELAHLLVYYHGLSDIPSTRRSPARTEWLDLQRTAGGLVTVAAGAAVQ